MKKYTNKILIITAIVAVLVWVIAYTIFFQVKYRKGEIKYEQTPDTKGIEMIIGDKDLPSDTYDSADIKDDVNSDSNNI